MKTPTEGCQVQNVITAEVANVAHIKRTGEQEWDVILEDGRRWKFDFYIVLARVHHETDSSI